MNGVDLNKFQFDYDTTWAAFFLDAKLNVYSRYGGRDEGEPEDRMTKASLLQTMREVLAVHAAQKTRTLKQRRRQWQPVEAGLFRPKDVPLLKQNHRGCVHCHQVREYRFLQAARSRTFTRRMLFDWPLPENLGLTFDRRHGHRVQKVTAGSAAARAGVKPGDVVAAVNGVPVHSEYDVRWALGRAKDGRSIRITLSRSGKSGTSVARRVSLRPVAGWRETELGWRKSMRSLPLQFGFRGYALARSQRRRMKLSADALAIRIVSVRGKGLAASLGLRTGDTILKADGKTGHRTLEQLKSDLVRRHRRGSIVRILVLRNGKRVTLRGRFPEWRTEETSVP